MRPCLPFTWGNRPTHNARATNRYGILRATRFGPDGKKHPSSIYVEVEDTAGLPDKYPEVSGRALIPVRPGASGAAKPSGPSRAGAVVIDDGKARARGMTSKLDGPAKPAHSRVIRGSARGDGTRRKDVLLRAGFRSEELDVGTYKPAKAIEYRKALRAAASERRKQGQKTPPVDALKNLKL